MIPPAIIMPMMDPKDWLALIDFVEDSVDEVGLDEIDPDEVGLDDESV